MSRASAILLFISLLATACAATPNLVARESAATPVVADDTAVASETTSPSEIDLEEAMRPPVLPTVTPTPKPIEYVVVNADGTRADGGSETQSGETSSVESTSGDDDGPEEQYSDRYPVGSCYPDVGHQARGSAISCSKPHRAEVVIVGRFPDGPDAQFPNNAYANDYINDQCVAAANSLGFVDASNMRTSPLWPHRQQWANGDRSFICFVRFTTPVSSSLATIAANQQAERAAEQARRDAAAEQRATEAAEEFEESVRSQELNVGDCVASDNETRVSCSQAHSYKAYAKTNLASAGGVYPGDSLLFQQAEEFCRREHEDAGLPGNIFALFPSRQHWEQFGQRAVVCMHTV